MGLVGGRCLIKGHPYSGGPVCVTWKPALPSAHPPLLLPGDPSAFFCFRFFPPFRPSTADWLCPKPRPLAFPAYSGAAAAGGVARADVGLPAVGWLRAAAPAPPQSSRESRDRSAPFPLKRGQGDDSAAHAPRPNRARGGARQAYPAGAVETSSDEMEYPAP